MVAGEQLKNAPLLEAVCELQLKAQSPWDWTIPGRLYDQIKDEFPERAQLSQMGVQFKLPAGDVQPLPPAPERVQLKRNDGSAMVQVGPRLLVMNQLRPYPGWNAFRDLIRRVVDQYVAVGGALQLSRIGLRYINQIPFEQGAELDNLLTVTPRWTKSLSRPLAGFYQRYEIWQDSPKGFLVHQIGILIQENEQPNLMLDLDLGSMNVEAIDNAEKAVAWLDQAHARVEEAFIDSLHPKLYANFKGSA